MTGSERKRLWRFRNPQRSRAAERRRAQARRDGFWDQRSGVLAVAVDPACAVQSRDPARAPSPTQVRVQRESVSPAAALSAPWGPPRTGSRVKSYEPSCLRRQRWEARSRSDRRNRYLEKTASRSSAPIAAAL